MCIYVANSVNVSLEDQKLFDNTEVKLSAYNGHLRVQTFDANYITKVADVKLVNDTVWIKTSTDAIIKFNVYDPGVEYCRSKKQVKFWESQSARLAKLIKKHCM